MDDTSTKFLPMTQWDVVLAALRRRSMGWSGAGPLTVAPLTKLAELPAETLMEQARDQQKVIYGVDDRVDLHAVHDPDVLRDADAVVALFRDSVMTDNGDGTTAVPTLSLGDRLGLCPSEPFRDQPSGAFCSGVMVGSDLVATAGHCVDASTVTGVRFVFGYRMRGAGQPPVRVSNAEVYRGRRLVGRVFTHGGSDWALVRLDRPVRNHVAAAIRASGRIADARAIHVIGHPSGLPTKYAPGATVRDNTPVAFFRANLDTYGGNSGSPVFDHTTHVVEGLLVRGQTDYVTVGSCRVSMVVPTTGVAGEDVTRTTEFAALVDAPASAQIIRRGDTGPAVQQWQSQLLESGSSVLDTDGIFGPITDTATTAFQRDHGLTVDGVVGRLTRAAMQRVLAAAA